VGRKGRFSGITNVHGDGTITIPKQVRSRLGLKPFDHLLFQLKGGQIIASKVEDDNRNYYVSAGE
jgi:AbrB family looped-hinge helix DNA binding protein